MRRSRSRAKFGMLKTHSCFVHIQINLLNAIARSSSRLEPEASTISCEASDIRPCRCARWSCKQPRHFWSLHATQPYPSSSTQRWRVIRTRDPGMLAAVCKLQCKPCLENVTSSRVRDDRLAVFALACTVQAMMLLPWRKRWQK